MSDGNAREDWEGKEFQIVGDQTGNLVVVPGSGLLQAGERQRVSPKHDSLQKVANRRAVDDIIALKKLAKEGKYISLDLDKLAERGQMFARSDISNDDLRDASVLDYEDLLNEYQEAYQRRFHEGIQQLTGYVTVVRDEKERRLRDTLSQDRILVQTRSPGDWHARDLVLIRILQIYYWDRLEKVDINVLLERHAFIDRYEKYVLDFESRNEVTWPDQDSFLSGSWQSGR
jgi:hypothetical protein